MHYAKQTYFSHIRRDNVCNTFQKPVITSVIDVKKIAAWGESGFPARFLEDSEYLPPPDQIAEEIMEDLRAALEQLEEIAADLGAESTGS